MNPSLRLHRLTFVVLLAVTIVAIDAFAQPPGGRLRSGAASANGTFQKPAERPTRTRPESVPQPTGQNLTVDQKANLQHLQTDLNAIKAGSTVTPEQKTAVADSLAAVADGATRPSDESITALANSLTTATADGNLTPKEKKQLSENIEAVLNSPGIPPEEVAALVSSTEALLTASGVSKEDAETLANDMRAIGEEIQANAGSHASAAQSQAATLKPKLRERTP